MSGFNVFSRRMGSILKLMDEAPQEFVEDATAWVEEDVLPMAHDLVPKDTGVLDESIGSEVRERQIRIFATAPHAETIERGSSTHEAQPYLEPSIRRNRDKLSKRTRARVKARLS